MFFVVFQFSHCTVKNEGHPLEFIRIKEALRILSKLKTSMLTSFACYFKEGDTV